MASLLSWAKGVERQVNPFDHGATASHPASPIQRPAAQQAAQPQQGLAVRPVVAPRLGIAPLQQRPLTTPTFTPQPVQQPLQVRPALQQPLQAGNQTILPSPNRTGNAAMQPKGNRIDMIGAIGFSGLSSAAKAAANTVHGISDVRFLTPNFIPGVRSTIDPAIARLSTVAAAPFSGAQHVIDSAANNKDLYSTNAGQVGQMIGSKAGAAAVYLPQVPGAIKGAVAGAKMVNNGRKVIQNTPQLAQDAKKALVGIKNPHPDVSPDEASAIKRVQDNINGWGDNIRPGDIQTYRSIQKQKGFESDPNAMDNMLQEINAYNANNTPSVLSKTKGALTPIDQSGHIQLPGKGDVPVKNPVRASSNDTVPATKPKLPPQQTVKTPKVTAKPVNGASLAQNTPNLVNNRFVTGVKNSPEVSKEVQAQVEGSHVPRDTAALVAKVQADVKNQGLTKATNTTLKELSAAKGTTSDETLARAIEIAKQHDAIGTESSQTIAANLYKQVDEHAVAKGQGVQILSILKRRGPAGLRNTAFKDIEKAGTKLTPAIRAEIQSHIDKIAKMVDGPAKDYAIAELRQAVSKHIPQSKIDTGVGLWKAGLLSGVKTQEGNAISNGTFKGLKKVADIPAVATDKLLSLATGKRTKTLTQRGELSGTKQGLSNAKTTMQTGIDVRGTDKYEQHAEINLKNKYLNATVGRAARTVFRGMNAADQPFWYAALKNSLYDQAKADGVTKGLKGLALKTHMEEMVKNPTQLMADVAEKEANKAVLGYDTYGSKAIQGIHAGIDKFGTAAGRKVAHGVVDVLAPFVRVPSAFLSRTIDFTPLGPIKEIGSQIAHGKFDQRDLSQAIGEGVTGTGVIALGIALAQHNLLSGDYPKNDQKEAQRWKAEGITPNSLKVGNKWINLNYLGPVGLLFGAGKNMADAKDAGSAEKAGRAIAGLGQGLLGQSFLQGFTGFSDAVKDPERNLKSFANSQAASIIPSFVNDIANVTDKMQRQADTVTESIKSRLPVLRETVKAKQDVYGNELKQPGGQLGAINGFKPSNSLTNNQPVTAEVSRLHAVNPDDSNLQVTPTPVGKSVTVEGKAVALDTKQRYNLQKQIGQATQTKWGELIKTPEYKAMDDTQKAAALGNIKGLATEDATRAYVVANNLGTYNKPESPKATALNQSSDTIANLASSKATGGVSSTDTKAYYKTPDAKYKALQATYNQKVKNNGFGSPAAQIKAQNKLQKAQVGSTYDKSIRDAYELSNADLYKLVSTDKNGNDIVKQVLNYSQALKDAGITSTAKFKNKYGQVTIAPTTTKATKGRAIKAAKLKPLKAMKPVSGKTAIFKVKSVKAPTFKAKRAKIPSYVAKTPKLNRKALA